jgi:foldase protein PrsA
VGTLSAVPTKALAAAVLALLLVAAGCGSSSHAAKKGAAPSGAVAQVGDETIPASRLDAVLTSARAYYKQQKRAFPKQGTSAYTTLRAQAVGYLVQGAVFEQKAKEMGISVSDDQISKTIATIKKTNFGGSEKKFEAALKQQGLTLSELREQERLSLTEKAIQQKVVAGAHVSDAAAKAYYAKHKSSYAVPATREVRHILVAKKALADTLYARLQNGASFAALARKYSTDTGSKAQGGRLTDTKGTFVPEFEQVAFSLKTNEISKPVHSQYGWHIIQALAPIKAGSTQPYSTVSSSIKQTLLQSKQSADVTSWTKSAYHEFCSGKISYGTGYKPPTAATDVCKAQAAAPTATG